MPIMAITTTNSTKEKALDPETVRFAAFMLIWTAEGSKPHVAQRPRSLARRQWLAIENRFVVAASSAARGLLGFLVAW